MLKNILLNQLLYHLHHKVIFSISSLIVVSRIFMYSALDTPSVMFLSGFGLDLILHYPQLG